MHFCLSCPSFCWSFYPFWLLVSLCVCPPFTCLFLCCNLFPAICIWGYICLSVSLFVLLSVSYISVCLSLLSPLLRTHVCHLSFHLYLLLIPVLLPLLLSSLFTLPPPPASFAVVFLGGTENQTLQKPVCPSGRKSGQKKPKILSTLVR